MPLNGIPFFASRPTFTIFRLDKIGCVSAKQFQVNLIALRSTFTIFS